MKIEELIIDGFKSYAVRTTIDKWDPTFNAITVRCLPVNLLQS
jgi:structural maintenance of chromosome 2